MHLLNKKTKKTRYSNWHVSLSKKSGKSWAFSHICGIIKAVIKEIVKQRENRNQMEIFSIEEFVPEEHLLRKIDSAIDFTHIYDIVEELY